MLSKKTKSFLKIGSLCSLLGIGLVVGIVVLSPYEEVIIEHVKSIPREWISVADADPGGDNSGFMYFMVYPHSATPHVTYAVNLSNATAYEYSDSLNAELSGETPYSTTFDFVGKIRVNDTVGYNTTGSTWEDSWVRGNITCDFDFASDIGADTNMTVTRIWPDNAGDLAEFAYYHVWIQDTDAGHGAGFTLTQNEKFNVTSYTNDVFTNL